MMRLFSFLLIFFLIKPVFAQFPQNHINCKHFWKTQESIRFVVDSPTFKLEKEKCHYDTRATYIDSQAAKRDAWARRRNRTLLGTAVFAATSGALMYWANKRYDDYKEAITTSAADAARKDVQTLDKYSQVALIGAGVMAVWTLYNQIRKSTVKVPKQNICFNYDVQKKRIALIITF